MPRPLRIGYSRLPEKVQPKRWQIKHHPVALAAGEKASEGGILGDERVEELGADLIGALADGWANHGVDPLPLGAQRLHRIDSMPQNAREGALPAGMGCADNACLGIGKQDRLAIGGQNRERHAGKVCHHCIGRGAGRFWVGHHDDIRRMDLMDTDKLLRPEPERRGNPSSVDRHGFVLIRAAIATVEAREDA